MPFEEISTFDGIVELNHQNTDSSQNADDSNQDNTLMCELSSSYKVACQDHVLSQQMI